MNVLALRLIAIAVGVALFAYAEFRDAANERTPYATGSNRNATFNRDLTVFGLRVAGVLFVAVTLLTWVIGHGGSLL